MNSKKNPDESYSVALFYSISGALRAEKLLKAESLPIKLIPVPRHLSSDCGICVRFKREDEPKVERVLNAGKLDIQGIRPM
ncbi:MAG: DUF3343 domain-containing protein [Chloroflexota bacterium]|nr:DUF3343 domain-containing protein [Chloroflexota bacterium]